MSSVSQSISIIEEAALWFSRQHPHPSPPVPALCQRFDLTPLEAVKAIRLADTITVDGRAGG